MLPLFSFGLHVRRCHPCRISASKPRTAAVLVGDDFSRLAEPGAFTEPNRILDRLIKKGSNAENLIHQRLHSHRDQVCQGNSIQGMSKQAKLVQLRSKTDRDLIILVRRELDRGLALADVATTKDSPLYAQAERAYATAASTLPRIAGLNGSERRELEGTLKQLRGALDSLPSAQVQRSMAGVSRGER